MDNLLSKLTRLYVEERSFTPAGSNDVIKYNVAILSVQLNGQPSTIELKIGKDKTQILQLADSIGDSL